MKQKKHVKFKMFLQKGMRKIIMEIEKNKAIIEAILYTAGREVKMSELMAALELGAEDITTIIESMKAEYKNLNRGIEIIEINGSYQLCTKKNILITYILCLTTEQSQTYQQQHWKH